MSKTNNDVDKEKYIRIFRKVNIKNFVAKLPVGKQRVSAKYPPDDGRLASLYPYRFRPFGATGKD